MDHHRHAIIAWILTLATWLAEHFSFALSAACGVLAIFASVYSIRVNRAKLGAIRAHREAACNHCKQGAPVECPYPENSRPSDCKMNL